MKKMLLLVGMLAVSGLAFAGNSSGLNADEDKIEVKARVIAPLNLEVTKNIDFGTLIKGDTQVKSANGEFEVTGEAGEVVAIYVGSDDKSYSQVKHHEESYAVDLKKVGGEEDEKITANLNLNPKDGRFNQTNGSVTLIGESGKEATQAFEVWGVIASIDKDIAVGEYKGYLHVKAQYE